MDDKKPFLEADKRQEISIDVVSGSLCLFPSSLHHYTIPFESEEARIVLAFDVTPAKYVTGLITEKGVCEASEKGLKGLFK